MPSVLIQPKEQFQEQTDLCKNYAVMAHGAVLPMTVTYALAEFCATLNASSEELSGARKFAFVLLNMADKADPPQQFPVKRLTTQTQRHD